MDGPLTATLAPSPARQPLIQSTLPVSAGDDIANRFADIGRYARSYGVDGAILYVYRYCDPFGFEVPARKAFYESIDVPLLHLESGYSAGAIGQMKTRIQAFLEMIG